MINTWILLNYFYRKITDEIRIKERKQAEVKLKKNHLKTPLQMIFHSLMQ